jgi:hypothetical protein
MRERPADDCEDLLRPSDLPDVCGVRGTPEEREGMRFRKRGGALVASLPFLPPSAGLERPRLSALDAFPVPPRSSLPSAITLPNGSPEGSPRLSGHAHVT